MERKKNLETLADLGLLPRDILDCINELTPEDYCNGPNDDLDYGDKDCIWEFGKDSYGCEIYIKLKVDAEKVKDISFHKAERKLKYHYRK